MLERMEGLPHGIDGLTARGKVSKQDYERVFAPLLMGGLDAHDPWDPAHRTGREVESPVGCTVFRTFQGWTALSDIHPSDGVLHVVPIPLAVAYRFMVGLAGELGLGGPPEPAPRRDAGDALIARALAPIPPVAPGDTVWWHPDVIHAVEDEHRAHRRIRRRVQGGDAVQCHAAGSCPGAASVDGHRCGQGGGRAGRGSRSPCGLRRDRPCGSGGNTSRSGAGR